MANKFKEIRVLAEEAERIFEIINDRINDMGTDYVCVGQKQQTRWNGELMWEDEEKTVPKMTDDWQRVPKQSIDEDDKARIDALKSILKHLEKMF